MSVLQHVYQQRCNTSVRRQDRHVGAPSSLGKRCLHPTVENEADVSWVGGEDDATAFQAAGEAQLAAGLESVIPW